jgi:hypothetical protein
MTATMAMSAETRPGICQSVRRQRRVFGQRLYQGFGQNHQTGPSDADPSEADPGAQESELKRRLRLQWHSRNHMVKIVEKHGSLFRLSDAAYRRLLELVIAEQEYDLWELGRCIGCIHTSMGSFQRDDAEFELARLDVKRSSNSSAIVQPNASNRRKRPVAGRFGRNSIECK